MTSTAPLRRYMPAALLAAATALGVVFADPAIASAAPKEWDIGTYNDCIQQLQDDSGPSYAVLTFCCAFSGGVWNEAKGECVAPPATDVERTPPPRVPPPAQTTAPFVPASVPRS